MTTAVSKSKYWVRFAISEPTTGTQRLAHAMWLKSGNDIAGAKDKISKAYPGRRIFSVDVIGHGINTTPEKARDDRERCHFAWVQYSL